MHDSVMLVSGGKYFFLFFILALFLSTAEVQAADPNKGRKLYMQHCNSCHEPGREMAGAPDFNYRSEERRVGKECRSRWSPYP